VKYKVDREVLNNKGARGKKAQQVLARQNKVNTLSVRAVEQSGQIFVNSQCFSRASVHRRFRGSNSSPRKLLLENSGLGFLKHNCQRKSPKLWCASC
jgi:hypothetical protein